MITMIYMLLITVVNGQLIGQYRPGAKIVQYFWKGILIGRLKANNPRQTQTTFQVTVKAKMTEYANRFRETLTSEQRSAWDAYAGSLPAPTEAPKGGAKNIIPGHRRNSLQSGINTYVGTNVTEFLTDGTGPDDIAPLGDPVPPPPLNVALTGAVLTGIVVAWDDPILIGTPSKKFVRVWVKRTSKPKAHAQLIATVAIGVQTYTITEVRMGSKAGFPIDDIGKGKYLVQMDTITAVSAGRGCITSAPSNVAEINLA